MGRDGSRLDSIKWDVMGDGSRYGNIKKWDMMPLDREVSNGT